MDTRSPVTSEGPGAKPVGKQHEHEAVTRIVRIQIYAVVQRRPAYSWSPVMPEVLNTDTIVRLTDETGLEGVGSVCTFTEFGTDRSVMESMRPLAIGLLQDVPGSPQTHWNRMCMRRPGVSNIAMAGLDLALWDLAANGRAAALQVSWRDKDGTAGLCQRSDT